MEELQTPLFDYSSLNAETRIVIQQRAGEIKTLAKRVAADIVEIGGKLAEVKDRLDGNGRFAAWLEVELGWSDRTAGNFIAVWQKFEGQNLALENFATSALYLLAAPSTPVEAIEAARQLADQGERVTHTTAKQLVERAKAKRPKQADLIDPVPPVPAEYIDAEIEEEDESAAPAPPAAPATVIPQASAAKPEEGPKDLPEGWVFDSAAEEGYRAVQPARKLQTLLFAAKREALVAAHQIQASLSDGTAGLAGRSLVAPIAPAPARPMAWSEERVEISITLMPNAGGAPETRKVLFAVVAGDRTPYYSMSVGEIVIGQLPPKVGELIEKLSAALAEEEETEKAPAKKQAKKSPGKTKAARK